MEIANQHSKWFSERPKWLQAAAIRLSAQGNFSEQDISELAILCQKEALKEPFEADCSFSPSSLSSEASANLRICSISEIEGVNALSPRKPLEFGEVNITVIYGLTGSGKSSYVRLLKHICGSRHPGFLYRNVYKPDSSSQKAKITFKKNSVEKSHAWSAPGYCSDLRDVDIFDSLFGRIFIENGSEVSYEPPILGFFSSLIEVCERVEILLDSGTNLSPSKRPNMPTEKKNTSKGSWYDNISANTKTEEIDYQCSFEKKDEEEMHGLQQRLAEQAPLEKIKQYKSQKYHIDTLIQDAQKFLTQLSDENYRLIIEAKNKLTTKKDTADIAALQVFSESQFEGVGSDIWKELWKAAKNYSTTMVYKELEFPNVSETSRCVLCHQTLTEEAKNRLLSFENFIKNELQQAVNQAENEYKTIIQRK